MTVRLTVATDDAIRSMDYAERREALHDLIDAWQPNVRMVVLRELDAPEEITWGRVREGDEIIAPDGSCWMFEGFDPDVSHVRLTAVTDGRPLAFPVTPNMPIRRRPGVLTAAVQLVHDLGLCGGPA